MIKNVFIAHPIMILRVMKPYLFVLILPLIRALVQYLMTGDINGLLTLEIVAAAFILVVAILGWRSIKITVGNDFITVEKGFFIKSCAKIEISRLSSIALKQNIFDFVFQSVSCSINTEAGRPKKSDFDIKMNIRDAKRFYQLVYGTKNMQIIKFSAYRIALMAATTSSAVSGIIVAVPIINEISRLINVAISEILLNEINVVSSKFNTVFPPIVNTVTIILLAAYGASFTASFLKNVNFRLKSDKENIEIRSGFIVRKRITFKKSKVNDICFEQTALMRIFRKYSMRVSVGGYGDSHGEKAVIVPVAEHKELERQLKKHLPLFKTKGKMVLPRKSILNINRFFYIPALIALAIIGSGAIAAILLDYFDRVAMLLMTIALCADVYYASICYHDYKYCQLSLGNYVLASGSEGLKVREMYCNKDNIGVIKLYQTPADKKFRTCKVKITIRSENADSVKVRNLDIKETTDLINSSFKTNINE